MGVIRPYDEKRLKATAKIARPKKRKDAEKLSSELGKLKARYAKKPKRS